MRVFLCSFAGFSVAIPMSNVASMIVYKSKADQTIEYDHINKNTFISLPLLLNNPQAVIHHGLIFKSGDNGELDDDMFRNKTILLTTEIEYETEIPSENIFRPPEIFSVFKFNAFFSGISFNSRNMVLFFNPEESLRHIGRIQ